MKKIFTAIAVLLAFLSFSQVYIDPGMGILLTKTEGFTPYRVNAGLHNVIANRLGFYATAEFGKSASVNSSYFRDIEGGILRLSKVVSVYGGIGFFSNGVIENGLKISGIRKEVGLDILLKKINLNVDVGYSISRGFTTNLGYVISFKKSGFKNKSKSYNIPLAENVRQPEPPAPQLSAQEADSTQADLAKADAQKISTPVAVAPEPVVVQEAESPDDQVASLLKGENVKFNFGQTQIDPSYIPKLKELIVFLSKNDQYNVVIYGHTCDIGSDQVNQVVSQQRADVAKRFLIDGGINASRITARGMGEKSPLVPNTNQLNRMKNRRIEFEKVLIKK